MGNLFYINGEILTEAQAVIPVMDRGFLFGDGVYEVIRTRGGRFLAMGPHLKRLRRSAERIKLELPFTDRELYLACRATVDQAENDESYVRIILTRGTASAPNIDLAYAPAQPNLVIMVRELEALPATLLEQGLRARIVSTKRIDKHALDPAIKSGNYLNNILGLIEARAQGDEVAIFLSAKGELTEAHTSNLWFVKDGRLLTPSLDSGILEGITRSLLLEYAKEEGRDVQEGEFKASALLEADEVFLSSSIQDIAPVTTLNGLPIADGRPGPCTLSLAKGFCAHLDELARVSEAPEQEPE